MYVYLITNTLNGMKYVGRTVRSPQKRFSEHCTKRPKWASLIYSAIQKYGKENFKLEVLQECEGLAELIKSEADWILKLKTVTPYGYNLEVTREGTGRPNYGKFRPAPKAVRPPIVDLNGEEWKEIEGFEGSYLVSNKGRVKSVQRTVKGRWGTYSVSEKILKPSKSVFLIVEGQHKRYLYGPRLVFSTFKGEIPEGYEVLAIDGNKRNFALDNLRLIRQEASLTKEEAGVTQHLGKFQVRVTINKTRHYVGVFKTKDEAIQAKLAYIKTVLGCKSQVKEN